MRARPPVRPALRLALLVGVAATLSAGGRAATLRAGAGRQEVPFPHAAHQGLFPLCAGCHEGIPTGDPASYYPSPTLCAGCHDGVERERVTWQGPTRVPGNLTFEHARHAGELSQAGDPEQECASCHIPPGGERMAVSDSVQVRTCLDCHAHRASDHRTDADCATCHLPLADTQLGKEQIANLPLPSDHRNADFVADLHGVEATKGVARCATCHTQERCEACHVAVDRDAIAAMPSAPPGMELPAMVAHYPEPPSHLDEGWLTEHGGQASRDSCATCHTSTDCLSCHVEPAPRAVAALPSREQALAPGVRLTVHAPPSHESAFFMKAHPTLAASDESSCATCHVQSFCVGCHEGPATGGYHPPDFVARHTAEAAGRDAECATCHNTQAFCRECHVQAGLVGSGRLGPGYHDGGPAWLLRHGQAARQNLESCASCHKQVDCTQCHGVLGAFKVSPHGQDFDAERAWARSPRACLGCHVGNPLNGGG